MRDSNASASQDRPSHPPFAFHLESEATTRLVDVSQGRQPADAYVRGGQVVNVFSGEMLEMNVAIAGGLVAYVGISDAMVGDGTELIDAQGAVLVPGYVNAHSHPWMGHHPLEFARAVLPHGTTCIVSDSLVFLMFVQESGTPALIELMRQMSALPMKYFWVARAAPQSILENEQALFTRRRISELLDLDCVVGMAELTRWKDITNGNPDILWAIDEAIRRGKAVDGHTAGASYDRLNGIAAAGVNSCHEAITTEQALDRLRLGMWTMLRHSCLRADLPELARVITEHHADTSRLILTSDGPDAPTIERFGDLDYVLEVAIDSGIDPITAYKMTTINPATLYGLDERLGAIAPGRYADILFLEELRKPTPARVMLNGHMVAERGVASVSLPPLNTQMDSLAAQWRNDARRWTPTGALFKLGLDAANGPTTTLRLPVLNLANAAITRQLDVDVRLVDGHIDRTLHADLLHIALVERNGRWISQSAIKGFADRLGGLASSIGCAAHPLVIGASPADMAQALERLLAMFGGIVLVENGEVLLASPLEMFGVMTDRTLADIAGDQIRFGELMKERGYPYGSLMYTMQFLACDFLPEVRLTSAGLVNIRTAEVLAPVRPL